MNYPSAPAIRLVLIAGFASFYGFCVYGGIINGGPLTDIVVALAPPYFAMLWVRHDSLQTGYWPAYHYGLILWSLAPVLLPHYAFKTRGLYGALLAAGLSLAIWLPLLASLVGFALYEDLPDFR